MLLVTTLALGVWHRKHVFYATALPSGSATRMATRCQEEPASLAHACEVSQTCGQRANAVAMDHDCAGRRAGVSQTKPYRRAVQRLTSSSMPVVTILLLVACANAAGASSSSFTVVGPCTVDGACARSPNYPSEYSNRQTCTITPTSLAVGRRLSATAFNTERTYDKLTVNGRRYSGTVGPSNVLLGSAFTWSSDGSVTGAGWEVCAQAAPPPPPSTSPPPPPSPSPPPPPSPSPPPPQLQRITQRGWCNASRAWWRPWWVRCSRSCITNPVQILSCTAWFNDNVFYG